MTEPAAPRFRLLETDPPLIARLSPKYQAILAATGSYKEIMAALGIRQLGTVRSRLSRARMALVALREEAAANG